MGIDLIVLIVVTLFVFLGYRRGLLGHLAGLGALVVASLTAGAVAREAVRLFTSGSAMPSPMTYVLCGMGAWVLLFFLSRFLFLRIAKKLGSTEGGEPKPWNKKLGALAGAAEALALCWFVVGILDALPEDYRRQHWPSVHQELEGSFFTNWVVRPTSPATRLELQPLIRDLAILSDHPEALRGIERKPEVQKIARNPKVAAILQDPELVKEWLDGRYGRFFSDRKVRAALADPELREMLRDVPVRAILHEAAERAGREGK